MWQCDTCEKPVPYGSELHCQAKEHLKQALISLRGVCVACSTELLSPSAVKLHVQQKKHLSKVKRGCHLPWSSVDRGWFCESCAVHFSKQLGWEVHLASSFHQDSLRSDGLSSLPSVEALVEHLSGVPISACNTEFQPVCNLCDESCEGLGEFVFHLLSKEHVQKLRQCMCPGCKKYFSIIELFSHLRSQKHLSVLKSRTEPDGSNGSLSMQHQLGDIPDLLSDEVQMRVESTRSEGTSSAADLNNNLWFPAGHERSVGLQWWWNCSHCLIACRSWHGFSVHLRDKFHADNIPRMWTVALRDGATEHLTYDSRMIACTRTQLQVEVTPYCSLPTTRAWQTWKEQRFFHSGWCHACGIMLNTPHLVEQHLANHVPPETEHTKLLVTSSSGSSVGEGQEYAEIFECKFCSVSFCNDLGLTIHIALQQHQLRCSTCELHENSAGGWCESCGVTTLHHALSERTVDLAQKQDTKCSGQEIAPAKLCEGLEDVEKGEGSIHNNDMTSAVPKETVFPGVASDRSDNPVPVSTCDNPEFQLSLPAQNNQAKVTLSKFSALTGHQAATPHLVEGDSPSDALTCYVTSETPIDAGPKAYAHCQSATVDAYSALNTEGQTCGDSFCTRDGCCEVQPLLIEIPTSPGGDTGDKGSFQWGTVFSPSSIAKRMLLSLADGEERQEVLEGNSNQVFTWPLSTPLSYETRDFLKCCHANDSAEEEQAWVDSADPVVLSLSVSPPSIGVEPDPQRGEHSTKLVWSLTGEKRPGDDGRCLESGYEKFQGSKHIKLSDPLSADTLSIEHTFDI